MKDFGNISYLLGEEMSSSTNGYYLTQAKYNFVFLSWAGLTNNEIVDTLVKPNASFTHDFENFNVITLCIINSLAALPTLLHSTWYPICFPSGELVHDSMLHSIYRYAYVGTF